MLLCDNSKRIVIVAVLTKGEYDNDLGWPFEGDFAIELLNWRADKNHLLATVDFSRRSDPNGSYTSRVYKKEYTPNGLGTSHFPGRTPTLLPSQCVTSH